MGGRGGCPQSLFQGNPVYCLNHCNPSQHEPPLGRWGGSVTIWWQFAPAATATGWIADGAGWCAGVQGSAVQQPDVKGAGGRGPSRIRSEHPRLWWPAGSSCTLELAVVHTLAPLPPQPRIHHNIQEAHWRHNFFNMIWNRSSVKFQYQIFKSSKMYWIGKHCDTDTFHLSA